MLTLFLLDCDQTLHDLKLIIACRSEYTSAPASTAQSVAEESQIGVNSTEQNPPKQNPIITSTSAAQSAEMSTPLTPDSPPRTVPQPAVNSRSAEIHKEAEREGHLEVVRAKCGNVNFPQNEGEGLEKGEKGHYPLSTHSLFHPSHPIHPVHHRCSLNECNCKMSTTSGMGEGGRREEEMRKGQDVTGDKRGNERWMPELRRDDMIIHEGAAKGLCTFDTIFRDPEHPTLPMDLYSNSNEAYPHGTSMGPGYSHPMLVTTTVQLHNRPPPFFYGKEPWPFPSCLETFEAMVISQSGLTDLSKLFYLRSCLRGEALDSISSIVGRGACYAAATERLRAIYNTGSHQMAAQLRLLIKQVRKPGEDYGAKEMLKEIRELLILTFLLLIHAAEFDYLLLTNTIVTKLPDRTMNSDRVTDDTEREAKTKAVMPNQFRILDAHATIEKDLTENEEPFHLIENLTAQMRAGQTVRGTRKPGSDDLPPNHSVTLHELSRSLSNAAVTIMTYSPAPLKNGEGTGGTIPPPHLQNEAVSDNGMLDDLIIDQDPLYLLTSEMLEATNYDAVLVLLATRIRRENERKDSRSFLSPQERGFIRTEGPYSSGEMQFAETLLIRQHQSRSASTTSSEDGLLDGRSHSEPLIPSECLDCPPLVRHGSIAGQLTPLSNQSIDEHAEDRTNREEITADDKDGENTKKNGDRECQEIKGSKASMSPLIISITSTDEELLPSTDDHLLIVANLPINLSTSNSKKTTDVPEDSTPPNTVSINGAISSIALISGPSLPPASPIHQSIDDSKGEMIEMEKIIHCDKDDTLEKERRTEENLMEEDRGTEENALVILRLAKMGSSQYSPISEESPPEQDEPLLLDFCADIPHPRDTIPLDTPFRSILLEAVRGRPLGAGSLTVQMGKDITPFVDIPSSPPYQENDERRKTRHRSSNEHGELMRELALTDERREENREGSIEKSTSHLRNDENTTSSFVAHELTRRSDSSELVSTPRPEQIVMHENKDPAHLPEEPRRLSPVPPALCSNISLLSPLQGADNFAEANWQFSASSSLSVPSVTVHRMDTKMSSSPLCVKTVEERKGTRKEEKRKNQGRSEIKGSETKQFQYPNTAPFNIDSQHSFVKFTDLQEVQDEDPMRNTSRGEDHRFSHPTEKNQEKEPPDRGSNTKEISSEFHSLPTEEKSTESPDHPLSSMMCLPPLSLTSNSSIARDGGERGTVIFPGAPLPQEDEPPDPSLASEEKQVLSSLAKERKSAQFPPSSHILMSRRNTQEKPKFWYPNLAFVLTEYLWTVLFAITLGLSAFLPLARPCRPGRARAQRDKREESDLGNDWSLISSLEGDNKAPDKSADLGLDPGREKKEETIKDCQVARLSKDVNDALTFEIPSPSVSTLHSAANGEASLTNSMTHHAREVEEKQTERTCQVTEDINRNEEVAKELGKNFTSPSSEDDGLYQNTRNHNPGIKESLSAHEIEGEGEAIPNPASAHKDKYYQKGHRMAPPSEKAEKWSLRLAPASNSLSQPDGEDEHVNPEQDALLDELAEQADAMNDSLEPTKSTAPPRKTKRKLKSLPSRAAKVPKNTNSPKPKRKLRHPNPMPTDVKPHRPSTMNPKSQAKPDSKDVASAQPLHGRATPTVWERNIPLTRTSPRPSSSERTVDGRSTCDLTITVNRGNEDVTDLSPPVSDSLEEQINSIHTQLNTIHEQLGDVADKGELRCSAKEAIDRVGTLEEGRSEIRRSVSAEMRELKARILRSNQPPQAGASENKLPTYSAKSLLSLFLPIHQQFTSYSKSNPCQSAPAIECVYYGRKGRHYSSECTMEKGPKARRNALIKCSRCFGCLKKGCRGRCNTVGKNCHGQGHH